MYINLRVDHLWEIKFLDLTQGTDLCSFPFIQCSNMLSTLQSTTAPLFCYCNHALTVSYQPVSTQPCQNVRQQAVKKQPAVCCIDWKQHQYENTALKTTEIRKAFSFKPPTTLYMYQYILPDLFTQLLHLQYLKCYSSSCTKMTFQGLMLKTSKSYPLQIQLRCPSLVYLCTLRRLAMKTKVTKNFFVFIFGYKKVQHYPTFQSC